MFVNVLSPEFKHLGLARLVARRGSTAQIEFFAGPHTDVQPQYEVPISALRQASIPMETRIFARVEGGPYWRVGRCLDGEGELIQVQFPNKDIVNLPSAEVFVRWRRPIDDPAVYLSKMITETPLFAVNRAKFIRSVIGQRAAALGMTAALSSSIELEPHQLAVAKKILHDPVQRYLLADEVGLGKTIEAGIVIRQYFMDYPNEASAIVIVPDSLVEQWRSELSKRFGLEGRLDSTLSVIGESVVAQVADALDSAGLLVIDEAHHISNPKHHNSSIYDLVCRHAAAIPRVLLLSATPALGNENAFLRMLHLLDPAAYPLDGVETFRRRIEGRQPIAETVAALLPDNALVLHGYLEDLANRFPDDEMIRRSVSALELTLERLPEPTDEDLITQLGQLRAHVSDTYRLDRRILRNRRKHLPYLTPSRAGGSAAGYREVAHGALARCVDEVRLALFNFVTDALDGPALKVVLNQLIEAQALGPEALDAWVAALPVDVSSVFKGELEELRTRCAEVCASEARRLCLYDVVRAALEGQTKVIIFCSSSVVADSVYAFLRIRMPSALERHGRSGSKGQLGWERFLVVDSCKVLVCDATAEEGLNLQGGTKAVVHYDLPLSPNRIEQRLGRVDRYGSGEAVRSHVLVCEDNVLERKWFDLLDRGFGVFSRSIASLQYLVDEVMEELTEIVVSEGGLAVDKVREALSGSDGRVQRELTRIDQQDSLDALTQDVDSRVDELCDLDSDWKSIRNDLEPWIRETLIFGTDRAPFEGHLLKGDAVTRYQFVHDASRVTLVPATEFAVHFADAMDRSALGFRPLSPVTHRYTFRRQTALTVEGRRLCARVMRCGDAFVNGLEVFTRNDDRGRVFAFWRQASRYEPESLGGADLFFRVDTVLEADLGPSERVATAEADLRAVRRRADSFMPPIFVTVWLNTSMQVVDPDFVERWLEPPYAKTDNRLDGKDVNLRASRWDWVIARGLPDMAVWSTLPQRAAAAAVTFARESRTTRAALESAASQVREAWDRRRVQLELRIQSQLGPARASDERVFDQEQVLAENLIRGIAEPLHSVDAIGAIFLSNEPLGVDQPGGA